ncbi:hypothetical protein DSO57_1004214 [Entomophthora muscae]|uniref:Uncharacterized protein n=1 Tax=Entomophthora muscae TaxID=34485 RepID=A0ACC2RN44_9FUNG|nr:hypothetical protein DSO57_1004214 [Entomophthora muscae]
MKSTIFVLLASVATNSTDLINNACNQARESDHPFLLVYPHNFSKFTDSSNQALYNSNGLLLDKDVACQETKVLATIPSSVYRKEKGGFSLTFSEIANKLLRTGRGKRSYDGINLLLDDPSKLNAFLDEWSSHEFLAVTVHGEHFNEVMPILFPYAKMRHEIKHVYLDLTKGSVMHIPTYEDIYLLVDETIEVDCEVYKCLFAADKNFKDSFSSTVDVCPVR